MDFSTIGSIRDYTRQFKLQRQWEQKKKTGNLNGHGIDRYVRNPITGQEEDPNAGKLAAISAKIDAGAKLTKEEMEFLRENCPQLYQKVLQIEEEEKHYAEALRRCKSQDQVRSLHMSKVTSCMQDLERKDGMAMYRLNRMADCLHRFAESGELQKLPTEGEIIAQRRAEQEARMAEAALAAEERLARQEQKAAEAAEIAAEAPGSADGEKSPELEAAAEAALQKEPDILPETESAAAEKRTSPEAVPKRSEPRHPAKTAPVPSPGIQAYRQAQEAGERRKQKAGRLEADA